MQNMFKQILELNIFALGLDLPLSNQRKVILWWIFSSSQMTLLVN
jgi:hypothetical protein